MQRKQDEIIYPSAERIAEYNILVLSAIRSKKSDKAEVLSSRKLSEIVEGCKVFDGDIYGKATYLMKSLIQKHPFASGNRRTAFVAAKDFLLNNKAHFGITDDPSYSRVMIGIREGFYTDAEITEWIRNGTIREFGR